MSFKITSAADIDIKSIPTRRQSQINWITRDHIRGARKVAVRLLGERLFELGGTDLMENVFGKAERSSGVIVCTFANSASPACEIAVGLGFAAAIYGDLRSASVVFER